MAGSCTERISPYDRDHKRLNAQECLRRYFARAGFSFIQSQEEPAWCGRQIWIKLATGNALECGVIALLRALDSNDVPFGAHAVCYTPAGPRPHHAKLESRPSYGELRPKIQLDAHRCTHPRLFPG